MSDTRYSYEHRGYVPNDFFISDELRKQGFADKVVKENNKMAEENDEFKKVDLFIPIEIWETAIEYADGEARDVPVEFKNALWDLLVKEVPEQFELEVGMVYEFPNPSGNTVNRYEIVHIGYDTVVIRRKNTNRAGEAGSKLLTTRKAIEDNLRSGTAILVEKEE